MNTEISKNLKCILMRSGAEVWLEDEFMENVKSILSNSKESRFLKIGEQFINTADITGIFDANTMEDITRRKNGQWKGQNGLWYNKGDRVCKCGNVIPFGKTCGIC